jgi:phage baseplate assembly protein W
MSVEIKLKRTKFVDIDLNFKAHPITNDISRRVDENAIVTSIRNLILTERFDHPFHPEIYSPIRGLLFELLTPESIATIRRSITYLITNFEPRIEMVKLDVSPYPDQNGIEVNLFFRIIGTIETLKTTFYVDRTL